MQINSPAVKIRILIPVFILFSIVLGYSSAGKSESSHYLQLKGISYVPAASTIRNNDKNDEAVNQLFSDSLQKNKDVFSPEELVRGERLFYGLAYLKEESVNCAACHNTSITDTLNWNPDAHEISVKYLHRSAGDLSRALLNPPGQKMAVAHKGIKLSPEDIVQIKTYMDKFVVVGLKPSKPVVTNILLFIIASGLFLFSIADLTISKKIGKKWLLFVIMLITGAFITYSLVISGLALGRSKDYTPLQPIKFSHAVHVGQNNTDCLYCHSSAPFGKYAGIPPVNVCLNCHLVVRSGTKSGVFEIAKVINAYDNNKPIEWIKVHNLPDHVFFSHAQHVSAGQVVCTECHGNIKDMNVLKQVSDLSMGWCINCHRTRGIDFNDNNFYLQYGKLKDKVKKGGIDSVTVSMIGGTECMKCHY